MISRSVSFIGLILTTAFDEVRGLFEVKINVGILLYRDCFAVVRICAVGFLI